MKKIYFKLLFIKHKLLQFFGLKDYNNDIIKIWYDFDKNVFCLFSECRSGKLNVPFIRIDKEMHKTMWVFSIRHSDKYGLLKYKNRFTIYTLYSTEKL